MTLIQTGKMYQFPVILFGRHYWAGLVRWLQTRVLQEGKISPGDLALEDPRLLQSPPAREQLTELERGVKRGFVTTPQPPPGLTFWCRK